MARKTTQPVGHYSVSQVKKNGSNIRVVAAPEHGSNDKTLLGSPSTWVDFLIGEVSSVISVDGTEFTKDRLARLDMIETYLRNNHPQLAKQLSV